MGRRTLVAAGTAAAVVLVPGVASAAGDPPTDPVGTLTDGLGSAAGALPGGTATTGGTTTGGTTTGGTTTGGTTTGGTTDPGGTTGGTPALPAPGDPGDLPGAADLKALFDQLAGALQVSPECSEGVLEGVQLVVTDLTELPQQLQDLLGRLSAALQQGPGDLGEAIPLGSLADGGSLTLPAPDQAENGEAAVAVADSGSAGEVPLLTDLQGLLKTLAYDCLPHPAASSPSTPAPAAGGEAPQQPAAPAAAPVAQQPVSYLGYAPTGGTPEEPSGTVPVLAGVLLLSAVGTAGYRVSTRAARSRG